jgi:cytochrome d ubiquinol oxidase subunit I
LEDALVVSRLQFAFTVTYHYLFPMLTMGLALLIFVLKSAYMRNRNELYNDSARFWGKIFAVTFVMGVVTGILWSSSSGPTGLLSPRTPGTS